MSNAFQVIYLAIQLISILIFLGLFFSAWQNYLSRGARSFLLVMFTLLGFQSFFLISTLAEVPLDKDWTMTLANAFLFMFPLAWTIMVRELAEMDRKKSWQVLIPQALINLAALNVIVFVPGVYEYGACFVESILVTCERASSPIFMLLLGIIIVEMFVGAVFLLRHYLHNPNAKERNQIIALLIAVVGVPIVAFGTLLIMGDVRVSPMPIIFLVAGVLFYNAVFNYKILGLRFSESEETAMVDDLLLVVNSDHIVQDFNRSTLQVFNTQVKNLVNVQLEHAFVDYPQIISLFNGERVEGPIELPVDGVLHSFEPTVTVIMDQESGEEIGKRVQFHDISTDLEESTTPNIARDPVTNLYNQESFYLIGEKLLDHAKRTNTKMAMVVVGIDELDRLIEKYSSGVADELLKILVGVVAPLLQDADLIARLENNTLALLLLFPPDSNSTALEVCFRIKRKVGDMFFDYDLFRIQLSVSQGYTVYDGSIEADLQSMYSTARKALVNLQLEGVNGIDFMQLEQVQA